MTRYYKGGFFVFYQSLETSRFDTIHTMQSYRSTQKTFTPSLSTSERRINIVRGFVLVGASLMLIKLFFMQVINGGFYRALASETHEIYRTLFPLRGQILVRDSDPTNEQAHLYPLATNKNYITVWAEPRSVLDPAAVATVLAPILEVDQAELVAKLSKPKDAYEVIKKKVEDSLATQIKDMNLAGIHFQEETYRFYPEKNIGSNVLGFVGIKDDKRVGQYGLEGYFEDVLRGTSGELKSERDLTGHWIASTERTYQPAKDGADIILTIDRIVQYQACNALNEGIKTYEADSGALIIMNPYTGKIIAMCSYPDFDPNEYNKVDSIAAYNNTAVFEAYEPGSIFKPITMSAALDQHAVAPDTTYNDTGEVKFERFTIRNSDKKAHGITSMVEVLDKSLNVGMIFVVQKIGTPAFKRYLENYGFGEQTGITLKTESAGNLSSLQKKADIYAYTASFGQGITVTPLQMVQGFSAIANGGYLVKPYIVDEIDYGDRKEKFETKVIRKVIDENTSILLTGMLASVIKFGHGQKAQVDGYTIAGKTGTAQIADFENGGYSTKTNHSFIGFGPIDNPAFVMLVKLENPKKGTYAESTATPIFGRVAQFLFKYLKIPTEGN